VDWAKDELLWRLAAAATADFGQRGNAPVGLSLSLKADKLDPAAFVSRVVFGIGGGVHYTGRDDLNLGLELMLLRVPIEGWDTVAYPVNIGIAR
jgi:hypothetical protein